MPSPQICSANKVNEFQPDIASYTGSLVCKALASESRCITLYCIISSYSSQTTGSAPEHSSRTLNQSVSETLSMRMSAQSLE